MTKDKISKPKFCIDHLPIWRDGHRFIHSLFDYNRHSRAKTIAGRSYRPLDNNKYKTRSIKKTDQPISCSLIATYAVRYIYEGLVQSVQRHSYRLTIPVVEICCHQLECY